MITLNIYTFINTHKPSVYSIAILLTTLYFSIPTGVVKPPSMHQGVLYALRSTNRHSAGVKKLPWYHLQRNIHWILSSRTKQPNPWMNLLQITLYITANPLVTTVLLSFRYLNVVGFLCFWHSSLLLVWHWIFYHSVIKSALVFFSNSYPIDMR